MSSVYSTEPATNGKVVLKTNLGELEIELWSKECPLACKNFIQLALDGHYNGTIFHRVIKDYLVMGGLKGLNNSTPFRDEFHSRLRFTHRGRIALVFLITKDRITNNITQLTGSVLFQRITS